MDQCPVQPDDKSWAAGFRARTTQARLPVFGVLELTSRCNLRCQHCYLGSQTNQHLKKDLERDTESVLKSLDEWAEAGCLYLLITGGDPMMRTDFPEVYRHAAELGMLVTVFCDGILVTDRIIELFIEYPPHKVDISIYGATATTYETVTRIPGSHALAWKGIRRLHSNDIRLALKTMVLTLNQHELEAMADQAEELDCDFRFDSAVFPCLPDGSKEPLSLRVEPEVMVQYDAGTTERREMWAKSIEMTRQLPENDRLYNCGAGRTLFYCDPYGNLSPCLMTTNYSYSAEGRSFQDVWRDDVGKICERKWTKPAGSLTGALRGACSHCPAVNYVETGDEEVESDYMRNLARHRYEAVMAATNRENNE